MNIEMSKTQDGALSFSVEGHYLGPQNKQMIFDLDGKVQVIFTLTQVGVGVQVHNCCPVPYKTILFHRASGIKGWLACAKSLEDSICQALAEMADDGCPGMGVSIATFVSEVKKVEPPKPGKELIIPGGNVKGWSLMGEKK